MSTFKGTGHTVEEAIKAASEEALKSWKPKGMDDMARIHIESLDVIYGGFIGHMGTREATVSLQGMGDLVNAAATKQPHLITKLDVSPDTIWANMMPPVRRPQPTKVSFVFAVTNNGGADFVGQNNDSGVAHFAVLRGRQQIWEWPTVVNQVITPVKIRVGETLTFTAIWDVADIVEFINADLHVVARFVPGNVSAVKDIQVKAAF